MRDSIDIVCIALSSWDGPYMKSTVQLMRGLAERNRVLYVEYPFTVKDLLKRQTTNRSIPKARVVGWQPRLQQPDARLGPSLNVLTVPPVLPANGLPAGSAFEFVLGLNARIVRRAVQHAMNKLDMHRPVVINALNPTYGWALSGQLDESLRIYYCYDEVAGQPWNARHGLLYERLYLQSASAVITTSETLLRKKSGIARSAHLIPNAVDFDLFSNGLADTGLQGSTPVVGYIGSLDNRIDYRLLTSVAEKAPDLEFLFVGPILDPASDALSALENVRMVGPAARYEDLPVWLRQMDVCLIPFVKNEFTASIYPMKINEYLAAGKPVIRTSFADLPDFDPFVDVADTTCDFLKAILRALEENSREAVEARMDFAAGNSWQVRVRQLEDVIHDHLGRRRLSEAA